MRGAVLAGGLAGFSFSLWPAQAEPSFVNVPDPPAAVAAKAACPGNPDALGTSRTITVDAATFPRIGTMQYKQSLPLNDHEVVITFDDGPLPPYTDRILATLASECVKATYFLVGQMARSFPNEVRKIYNAGHTIGTHSQHHPFRLGALGLPRISSEVDDGIASVQNAVGDPRAVAPFFRIPGLARSQQAETFLASQNIAVWSADEVADDWHRGITPAQIVRLAMSRIENKDHRGVLLLHDIHPATAMALPILLKQLKAKGYRIVQAVAAGPRPSSVPERPIAIASEQRQGWPRIVKASVVAHREATSVKLRHHRHHRRDLAKTSRGDTELATLEEKKSKTRIAGFDFRWVFGQQ